MPDREKVIKGLEICTTRPCYCKNCPYIQDCALDSQQLMEEALALLLEQNNCENCAIAIEDRQPVVRCKDCKHSCDYTDIFPDHAYKCIKNGGYHNDCWFCADGERR